MKFLLTPVLGRVCLTYDLQTSNQVLQKRVLNFCYMPPPHNGVSLFENVYKLLSMWNIENMIFWVTLDNASTNDVFDDMLRIQLINKKALICNGDLFHLHCCAHILNLVVQDGLKEINVAIQKIHESIKYVRGSQGRNFFFFLMNMLSKWIWMVRKFQGKMFSFIDMLFNTQN